MFKLSNRSGTVLLVGEGNFSFSSSLLRKYPSFDPESLYASSYESRGECFGKYGEKEVSANIKFLEEKGAAVLHEVDATRLSEIECGRLKFDMIIFQFPHTGRKASIKQNRELLKQFFLSAKEHLNHSGSVTVTLCAGQGGTPSDIVQREYCNSWQIVEMAAEADFILTQQEVFDSSEFPGYICTGRRNRDNAFITMRAMSHRFILGQIPAALMPDWKCPTVLEDFFPSPIRKRLELLREKPEMMPCCWILNKICKGMTYKERFLNSEVFMKSIYPLETPLQKGDSNTAFLDHRLDSFLTSSLKNEESNVVYHSALFCPSKSEDGTTRVIFQHNMLIVSDSTSEQLLAKLSNILSHHCDVDFNLVSRKLVSGNPNVSTDIQKGNMPTSDSGMLVFGMRGDSEEPVILGTEVSLSIKQPICAFIINIVDLIKVLNSSISEQRMLCSLNEFTRTEVITALKRKTHYVPRYLHPPIYTHDFSFWVEKTDSDRLQFGEDVLIMIIFSTTDDVLFSMKLVDEYKVDRTSYCYRVMYHSRDFVLSRQNCLRLQDKVRQNVSALLNVTMR